MATFAFVHYEPKPSKVTIRKSTSKSNSQQFNSSDRNLVIGSSGSTIKGLPVLEGTDKFRQNAITESMAVVRDSQLLADNPTHTHASTVEDDRIDTNTDNRYPSLACLLVPTYEPELADDSQNAESTTEASNSQALDDSLLGSCNTQPGSTQKKSIIPRSETKSGHGNNHDHGPSRCDVEDRRPNCDDIDSNTSPMLSTWTTPEQVDGGNDNDTIMPYQTVKRQRSGSSSSTLTSRHVSTPLVLRKSSERFNIDLVGESDSEDSRIDAMSSYKRRKVSIPQDREGVSEINLLQPSPPLSMDNEHDEEDDGMIGICLDARLDRSARETSIADDTHPTELEVCPVISDIDLDWDVREIIGKEDIGGVSYYLVDWQPTLLPEHSLTHAKELVDNFETRLRVQRRVNNKQGLFGMKPKNKKKASVEAKAVSSGKKSRGRPRK